jgi:hypothetical protein
VPDEPAARLAAVLALAAAIGEARRSVAAGEAVESTA